MLGRTPATGDSTGRYPNYQDWQVAPSARRGPGAETRGGRTMTYFQELYDRVKKHPDAIVMEVGEAHPVIIHEAHALFTLKDGFQAHKIVCATIASGLSVGARTPETSR